MRSEAHMTHIFLSRFGSKSSTLLACWGVSAQRRIFWIFLCQQDVRWAGFRAGMRGAKVADGMVMITAGCEDEWGSTGTNFHFQEYDVTGTIPWNAVAELPISALFSL